MIRRLLFSPFFFIQNTRVKLKGLDVRTMKFPVLARVLLTFCCSGCFSVNYCDHLGEMEKKFPSTPVTVSSSGSGPSSPPVSCGPSAVASQKDKAASSDPEPPSDLALPPCSTTPTSSPPAASGSDPQPGHVASPSAAAPTKHSFASVARRVIVQERLRKAEEEDALDEEDGENIFVYLRETP